MYALPNKTQHKLIVKVRGGISQKLDNFNSSSASSAATGGNNNNSSNSKSKNTHFSSPSSSLDHSSSFKSTDPASSLSASFFKEPAFDKLAGGYENDSNLPRPIFHSVSNQNGNKQKPTRTHKQYITPEHNEMIRYVQQSWKGVERDYKKSVNNFINNIDLNGSSDSSSSHLKQKNVNGKKKTATTSTPLLLTGSYHHTSSNTKDSSNSRQDSFQPFDLETFWGNRILKRLTQEL